MSLGHLVSDHPGLVALVTAFAAACGFAVSTSMQHRTAGTTPTAVRSTIGILRFVVTEPAWLIGVTTGTVALVLHAVALKLGALALVQPVLTAGIVVAVPVRAALDRHLPSARELRSVTFTAGGLVLFLLAARPEPSSTTPHVTTALVLTAVGFAVSLGVAWIASRLRSDRAHAWLLGVASGILFGVSAALLKLIVGMLGNGGVWQVLTSWPLWGLVVGGVVGTAFNQRAYRLAPLAVSMPVLNVVDVLVSVLLGALVFGETPASDGGSLVLQGIALLCLGIGLRETARSCPDLLEAGLIPVHESEADEATR